MGRHSGDLRGAGRKSNAAERHGAHGEAVWAMPSGGGHVSLVGPAWGWGEPVGDGWGHGIGFWGLGLGQGRSAGGGPGRPIFEAQKMAKKAPERISKNQIFKKSKFEKNTKNGGPQRSLET